MSLTVSKCEQFVAEAPADKVKKHPAGDGLYFSSAAAAHTGPISSAVARRGRRKVSAAIRSSARRMRVIGSNTGK